jgi:UDP-N-acetylglucosamine 1-carboxyvinyltransferase
MIADRNDAVTLICAAVATRGHVRIEGVPEGIAPAINLLIEMGAKITHSKETVTVEPTQSLRNVPSVITTAFPGLSTDWGPMLQAVMLTATGRVEFTEAVFRFRFSQIEGFEKLGARIEITSKDDVKRYYRFPPDHDPHTAVLTGPADLSAATVHGRDIRGAAALVVAALAATGRTNVLGAEHIVRGYEDLPERLIALGANMTMSS